MAMVILYTCDRDLLPLIEAALAANGYVIEIPYQMNRNGSSAMVMSCGATSVLLAYSAGSDVAEIEIYGDAQSATVQLLRSLRINLCRKPCPSGLASL